MKTILSFMFVLLVSVVLAQSGKSSEANALVGNWLNEEKDARFQIYISGTKYYGKVLWGTGEESKDRNNPDPKLRDRELIGLVILKDFVYSGNKVWEEGSIYDPREGKTYACKITLTDPNILEVRGFVGISLFGRTAVWSRVK
jgi:uncharacterized protein (DUF2147 family)